MIPKKSCENYKNRQRARDNAFPQTWQRVMLNALKKRYEQYDVIL
jgi:hypothetical protein